MIDLINKALKDLEGVYTSMPGKILIGKAGDWKAYTPKSCIAKSYLRCKGYTFRHTYEKGRVLL